MGILKKFIEPVDMTEGSPWQKIVLFAVPMLVGNIAQQLYNTVDSVVVGNFVGDNALAAVGSAGPILNLLIVLFIGISMGASIMVSQYFGAKNRKDLSATIGNCIVLTALASVFVMVVATMLTKTMMTRVTRPRVMQRATFLVDPLFSCHFTLRTNSGVALGKLVRAF